MINDLRLMGCLVNAILPIAFDESLSYYECVCKMQVKLNEVIAEVNKLDVTVGSLIDISGVVTKVENSIAKINLGNSTSYAAPISEGTLFWKDDQMRMATETIEANVAIDLTNSRIVTVEEWTRALVDGLGAPVAEAVHKANAASQAAADAMAAANGAAAQAVNNAAAIESEVANRSELVSKDEAGRTTLHGNVKYGTVVEGNGFNNYVTFTDEAGSEYKVMVGTDTTDETAAGFGKGGDGSVNTHAVTVFGDDFCVGTGNLIETVAAALGNTWNVKNYAVAGASIGSDLLATSISTQISTAVTTDGTDYCNAVGLVLVFSGKNESGTTADNVNAMAVRLKQNFKNAKVVYCYTGTLKYSEAKTIINGCYANGISVSDFFVEISKCAVSVNVNAYVTAYAKMCVDYLIGVLNGNRVALGGANASVKLLSAAQSSFYFQSSEDCKIVFDGNSWKATHSVANFRATGTSTNPVFYGGLFKISKVAAFLSSAPCYCFATMTVNYTDESSKTFSGVLWLENGTVNGDFAYNNNDIKPFNTFVLTFSGLTIPSIQL